MKIYVYLILCVFPLFSDAIASKKTRFVNNKENPQLLSDLLSQNPKQFLHITSDPDKYRVQIIYTHIYRDKKNIPHLKNYTYKLDAEKYFYPASLVKLPIIALVLEKLNGLNIKGLDKFTRLSTDSSCRCQKAVCIDSTAVEKYPTIANYIKKMLLVSDNNSYNRVFDFLGLDYINKKLQEKGYSKTKILHKFILCQDQGNRCSDTYTFYNPTGNIIYQQPGFIAKGAYKNPVKNPRVGKSFMDSEGKIIGKPYDFSYLNYMSLQDIHDVLVALILPEATLEKKQFKLNKADFPFIYKYMSLFPRESEFSAYQNYSVFWDSYKKYLVYGDIRDTIKNTDLRIFNIVGMAFGFLSDCAYIVDFKTNTEFFVSATIYVNEDEILNDDNYEYLQVGLPFMANLGKVLYDYELKRKKTYLTDLSKFKSLY